MVHTKKGRVLTIRLASIQSGGIQEITVEIDGVQHNAVNYPQLTGIVSPGDDVLLNTTAIDLNLGTGGVHFVICNLSSPTYMPDADPGHMIKLRYTPLQLPVLSVEEDDSPNKEAIDGFQSLNGTPVVCCELHSQIAPVAAAIKAIAGYSTQIAYIMTDGAALPISFSLLIKELKEKSILDATITCGQAFGGDIEAINIYTALIAAKEVAHADVIIVCQGPGNAGTNSRYGFSGIQQGEAINAAGILGGLPVMALRMSFADMRPRHQGISHHSLTILDKIIRVDAYTALPELPEIQMQYVTDQLAAICNTRCTIEIINGHQGIEELRRRDIRVTTMGRSIDEDTVFFLAASASGAIATKMIG
ncbi:MAG: DUF3866 family protein [Armatimonadota bacterium]